MPAQKRSFSDSLHDADTSSQFPHHVKQQQQQQQPKQHEDEDEGNDEHEEEEEEEEQEQEGDAEEEEQQNDEDEETGQHQNNNKDEKPQDSDETTSSGSEDKSEFVYVELQEVRKDVQCPICLGIIKKTRTVMECLHRFCRECIDKSMRLGNNECPACRTHCASRRSLRDDPNYDALIAALYPDIEKYEEEELEFREEEKNRNKQIQASIAKVVQRQSEALGKKRKDTPGASVTRSQRNQRNVHSRRQNQMIDNQGSEDNEEENDNNEKDSSSADERCTEPRQRKRKRWTRVRPSQPSSSRASPDGGSLESDMDISRENQGTSRQVTRPRKLTWGGGGFRSHTRYGSGGASNSKISRSGRLSKLVDHLRNLDENADEFEIHLMLVSVDKQSTPILQQPHLCCRPTTSVKHLCEYVARQTPLAVEEVEILAVKGCGGTKCDKATNDTSALICDELTTLVIDPCKDELEILKEHESLAGITSKCISKMEHLILAYRRKESL
ncbi:PREDICTED: putative E3 ubiquitin-protein ligase RING1a isoform X2 [Lupinus angustifolius]|uniref:putative E3 ubiquitin-protein ligase RING1a isoform X2 n=1 Tax=Lupinus angustifolius TaxID=3871 RepID=UPI00092ED6D3|nr:PREDICTED: putative E3 ubiquitin-protein ligase RING1a isoform X2 [Lupinus angustifolius]